jgi:hypothetical protein
MLQSKAGYIDARPHIPQLEEVLLQRTAGPYIWVTSGHHGLRHDLSASPPKADIRRSQVSALVGDLTCRHQLLANPAMATSLGTPIVISVNVSGLSESYGILPAPPVQLTPYAQIPHPSLGVCESAPGCSC